MPKFGLYGTLPSSKEEYGNGYAAGRTWNHATKPAGPYVFQYLECKSCRGQNDACPLCEGTGIELDMDWIAFCDQSKKNNEQWWSGFNKATKEYTK